MKENQPQNKFTIDTEKIGTSSESRMYKEEIIKTVLSRLEAHERKPVELGNIVVTLSGPYAGTGLMLVEIKADGHVRVSPGKGLPTIDLNMSDVYHFDDYHEAFKVALVAEQERPDKKYTH